MQASQRKQFLLYKKFIIILLRYALFFLYFSTISIASSQENQQKAIFESNNQKHTIILEVAQTEQEQMHGLMFRKLLAENAGMVFVYNQPVQAGIWMKNTEIPLDIIFIDCNNKIVKLATRQPHTLEVTYAPEKICKIIEVNAGFIKKIGLKANSKVVFSPRI
jgi:hypothetical protein